MGSYCLPNLTLLRTHCALGFMNEEHGRSTKISNLRHHTRGADRSATLGPGIFRGSLTSTVELFLVKGVATGEVSPYRWPVPVPVPVASFLPCFLMLKTSRHLITKGQPAPLQFRCSPLANMITNSCLRQGRTRKQTFTEQPGLGRWVRKEHRYGHFENVKPTKLAVDAR